MIRGGRAGYDRLKVLAEGALPETAELLDRAGVGTGMRCIDLGCGTGDVCFELARRVGPTGHVRGVDQDEVKLALAREEAAGRGFTTPSSWPGAPTSWWSRVPTTSSIAASCCSTSPGHSICCAACGRVSGRAA